MSRGTEQGEQEEEQTDPPRSSQPTTGEKCHDERSGPEKEREPRYCDRVVGGDAGGERGGDR